MSGSNRWEKKKGIFFSLTQSLSTQLPVLFGCLKDIGLSPQVFPHRTHKISMMPTEATNTIPLTAHTLFRSQQFPALSSKLLSMYLPCFLQSIFYAWSTFYNLTMFSWRPWLFFLNPLQMFPPLGCYQFLSLFNPSMNKYWDSRCNFYYTKYMQFQLFVTKPVSAGFLIPWKFLFLLLLLSP